MTYMDTKKLISEAYLSDKNDQKDKVIVGLNGGIDSLVTAYLLKIQKYDLIAVTVTNDFPTGGSKFLSCHLDQLKLDKIKAFCHQLSIPHQVVKPVDEFQNDVIDPWIDSRMMGTNSSPCWSCHELRMKALYQKMKSSGAKFIATGHYAKIFKHESQGSVFVHTSNDEKNDQAPMLSRLPHEVLNCLMLPLSDLQKKEVIKLGENFGFVESERNHLAEDCFNKEDLSEYLTKKIPPKYRPSGEVYFEPQDQKILMHDGIHLHNYGSEVIDPDNKTAQGFVSKYILKEKKILSNPVNYFKRQRVILCDCHISDETPWHDVMKGAVIFPDGTQKECWVRPKALKRAIVEWDGEEPVLEGTILSITRKTGKNAKVYLTGRVLYLKEKVEAAGDDNVQKIDYARDF